jgi:acetyl-CoA carboxylase biotin carboxyl carrier protein
MAAKEPQIKQSLRSSRGSYAADPAAAAPLRSKGRGSYAADPAAAAPLRSKGRGSYAADPAAAAPLSAYALADIRVLAKILSQYDLSEVEVEQGGQRIRLRRERGLVALPAPAQVAPAPLLPAPAAPQPPATAPRGDSQPERAAPKDDGTSLISSPFVGTFYRAPSPESAPFVEVGQSVNKGQVLCIVEAMKLMNEIEAETSCKIVEILVKSGDPVEFGQALFKVFPLA